LPRLPKFQLHGPKWLPISSYVILLLKSQLRLQLTNFALTGTGPRRLRPRHGQVLRQRARRCTRRLQQSRTLDQEARSLDENPAIIVNAQQACQVGASELDTAPPRFRRREDRGPKWWGWKSYQGSRRGSWERRWRE
jgi:hypothetical protein